MRADTLANWKEEDVRARFEFALKSAYAHGTAAIRRMLTASSRSRRPSAFAYFVNSAIAGRGASELQVSALVSTDLYDDPANASLVDVIAEIGRASGGHHVPPVRKFEDPAILAGRLDRLFAIAKSRGLDVDLHVDETGAPASLALAQIAEAVPRNVRISRGRWFAAIVAPFAVLTDEQATSAPSRLRAKRT